MKCTWGGSMASCESGVSIGASGSANSVAAAAEGVG